MEVNKYAIINDRKFIQKCLEYGFDFQDFEIINDVIVITPFKNFYVLMDLNYNIMAMDYSQDKRYFVENKKKYYQNFDVISPLIGFESSLPKFTLEEIYSLANTNLVINNHDLKMLHSYIKFISKQAEHYFKTAYVYKSLSCNMIDIYTYLIQIMNRINFYIKNNCDNNLSFTAYDLINHLAQSMNNLNMDMELNDIIELIMLYYGKKRDINSPNLIDTKKCDVEDIFISLNTLITMANDIKLSLINNYGLLAKQEDEIKIVLKQG